MRWISRHACRLHTAKVMSNSTLRDLRNDSLNKNMRKCTGF